MLYINMVKPDILEVRETFLGFVVTKDHFFYTNIKTWESLTNPSASKQTDNFKVYHKLDNNSIEWIKNHHLPKLET